MKLFGYIEGYYGRELSGHERRRIVDRLAEYSCNAFLIGSKEDPFHRVHWKETPPDSYFDELTELIQYGSDRGVIVIPAVAPGLDYDFGSEQDEQLLITRLQTFNTIGARKIALLMDDLPLELPDSAKGSNLSLGAFHGKLLNRIAQVVPQEKLLFCPTLYTNELFGSGSESDSYLKNLKEHMPSEIDIFWTGENTIAEKIDRQSCTTVTDLFGERVIFWDNIYANDYATTRLFVGPFENRDHRFITESCGGIMINPTGMIETDLMILDLFGMWFQAGEATDKQWEKAAKRAGVPHTFTQYLPWFRSPFSFPDFSVLAEQQCLPLPFFNEYLVNWQSGIKREWYPYLHRFFTELKLVTGRVGKGPWFEQRFYPHTASKLKSENSSGGYSVL